MADLTASVDDLHARGRPASGRLATVCRPTDGAVVLGSAQPASDVDAERCRAEGLSVVRRRSGGGAVLVEPGGLVWVDFDLPPGDPLLRADVGASFAWLGQLWAAALQDVLAGTGRPLDVVTPEQARANRSKLARSLCFAAIGAGEVLLSGKKVVGLSQRRDRHGTRFHTMALLRAEPARLAGLLAWPPSERSAAERALAATSAPLPSVEGLEEPLVAAVLAQLG